MILKFSEGIEIVIDDEKIIKWKQSAGNRFITIWVREDLGVKEVVLDRLEEKFYKD